MPLGLNTSTVATSVLNAICNNTAYTGPASIYMQLHVGGPGPNGTGNLAVNTTRKLVAFGAPASGVASNSGTITWTAVAGTETYVNCTFWDAVTAGNFLFSGTVTAAGVTAGDTFTLVAGNITVTVNISG